MEMSNSNFFPAKTDGLLHHPTPSVALGVLGHPPKNTCCTAGNLGTPGNSLSRGYHLNNASACVANVCTCEDGEAATGAACDVHKEHKLLGDEFLENHAFHTVKLM